jgi:ssDNA-binding Zn-finger/Zn-ribbon topoisomerase 1
MLEGKCPKCGTYYHGWALLNPRHQSCPKCGTGLEITQDGQKIFIGYSPFNGQRYYIDTQTDASPPHNKGKGSHVPNE